MVCPRAGGEVQLGYLYVVAFCKTISSGDKDIPRFFFNPPSSPTSHNFILREWVKKIESTFVLTLKL